MAPAKPIPSPGTTPKGHPPFLMLTILYEDEHLLAVDKPAGQLVHATKTSTPEDEITMKIARDQTGHRLHTPHRLDRPTSGVLLMAKTDVSAKGVREAFDNRRVQKVYTAVVFGCPNWKQTTCTVALEKTPQSPPLPSRTDFTLVKCSERFSLINARPETGRYHQIRRHLVALGHGIVGDYRYSNIDYCDRAAEELGTGTRMLLQASSLTLNHPVTGHTLTISAPQDPALAQAVKAF